MSAERAGPSPFPEGICELQVVVFCAAGKKQTQKASITLKKLSVSSPRDIGCSDHRLGLENNYQTRIWISLESASTKMTAPGNKLNSSHYLFASRLEPSSGLQGKTSLRGNPIWCSVKLPSEFRKLCFRLHTSASRGVSMMCKSDSATYVAQQACATTVYGEHNTDTATQHSIHTTYSLKSRHTTTALGTSHW